MDDLCHLYAAMRPRKLCLCRNVTSQQIESIVLSGEANSLRDVVKITRASTGCGCCILEVRAAFERAKEKREAPLFQESQPPRPAVSE